MEILRKFKLIEEKIRSLDKIKSVILNEFQLVIVCASGMPAEQREISLV